MIMHKNRRKGFNICFNQHNSDEMHYTLIDDVNDTEQDAILLSELLKNRDIPVKFLFYNENRKKGTL